MSPRPTRRKAAAEAGANVVVVITHKGMAASRHRARRRASSRTSPRRSAGLWTSSSVTTRTSSTRARPQRRAVPRERQLREHVREDADHGDAQEGWDRVGQERLVRHAGRRDAADRQRTCGTLTYCDQAILDMLVPYRTALAAALDGKIGTTTLPFDRGGNIERRQEMPIGDLVADGMRTPTTSTSASSPVAACAQQFPTCTYAPVDTTLHGRTTTPPIPRSPVRRATPRAGPTTSSRATSTRSCLRQQRHHP